MIPTIVKYRHGHEECPAIITKHEDGTKTVSLVAFSPSGGTMYLDGIAEDPAGEKPCTWSFDN